MVWGHIPLCQWDISPLPQIVESGNNPKVTIADEVKRRMRAAGLNPKSLSRAAGVNETYVRDLLSGRSKNPRTGHLERIAVALECSVSELSRPKQGMEGIKVAPKHTGEPLADSTVVGEYDVYASAGGGAVMESENVVAEWQFPAQWLRVEIGSSLRDLAVITIEGDSMVGTLDPGDKVVIDVARKTPSPPGVFIVYDGLALVAKRLEYIEGSEPPSVRILSDNDRYRPYERTLDEVNIVGRVRGRWQRL